MKPETIVIVVIISILVSVFYMACLFGVYTTVHATAVRSWDTINNNLVPYSTLSTRDIDSVRLVISGCVRNNASYLNLIFAKLKTLETLLLPQLITYVFYENDSDDGSLGMLHEFLDERQGAVIAETGLNLRYPLRTHRLAYCRNRILDYCRKTLRGADILCMMDMDDVNVKLDVGSVVKALRYRDHWDGITANQSSYYYDLWALRTKYKNNNCTTWCGLYNVGHFFNLNNLFTFSIPVEKPYFLRVRSAFGGLGMYQYDLALEGEYNGVEFSNGKEECEHVAYHLSLARHKEKEKDQEKDQEKQQQPFRLFIAPFLINH